MVKRGSLLMGAVFLSLLPISCTSISQFFGDDDVVLKAPDDGDQAAEWWKLVIEKAPLNYLATFAEATDRHRAQGTSATYDVRAYAADVQSIITYRLPCPPPPGAEVLIRQRIAGYCPSPRDDDADRWWTQSARLCNRCSREQAMALWQEAKRAVSSRAN